MKHLIIILLFLAQLGFAQNYADSVKVWATRYHLKPIAELDTASENIPKNFITDSGWHVDFYGEYMSGYLTDGQQAFREIRMEAFIYNERYLFTYIDWVSFNFGEIIYDSLYYYKETKSLLSFKSKSKMDGSEEEIVFPKNVDTVGYSQFDEMVHADYDNGIFIELGYYCGNPEALALKATNVYSGQSTDIIFSKNGVCSGKNTQDWLKKVSYSNGILTIEVALINRKSKKEFVEVKKIKI